MSEGFKKINNIKPKQLQQNLSKCMMLKPWAPMNYIWSSLKCHQEHKILVSTCNNKKNEWGKKKHFKHDLKQNKLKSIFDMQA
jgi:hypothetical protein